MLLNKKKKNEFNILIYMHISKGQIKIMLYFPWKCKNMYLHIFWELITDLSKP